MPKSDIYPQGGMEALGAEQVDQATAELQLPHPEPGLHHPTPPLREGRTDQLQGLDLLHLGRTLYFLKALSTTTPGCRKPQSYNPRLQAVCLPAGSFDFLLKKKKMSFYSNEIVGSLAIILPAGRLLICRQAGF